MSRSPSKTLHSRPPIERMYRIHEIIRTVKISPASEIRYPNCTSIASELEVSTKTILRDIEFMKDRLELPLEYDSARYGYYYTEPVNHFPTVQITEGELLALLVAQKSLEQYRGTPFEHPLQLAFEKLSGGLQDQISVSWADLSSAISFRSSGATITNLELFKNLSPALLHRKVIQFEYKKLNATGYEKRRVHPYHLACISGQWYLFAFDLNRQEIRRFVLPRMRKLEVTGEKFEKPKGFSIQKHLAQSFGVFEGKENHEVIIRFDSFASALVKERHWHPTQVIRELTHDRIEIRMTLNSLFEIEPWILSWGEHAQVIQPPELIQKVKGSIQKMKKSYSI